MHGYKVASKYITKCLRVIFLILNIVDALKLIFIHELDTSTLVNLTLLTCYITEFLSMCG